MFNVGGPEVLVILLVALVVLGPQQLPKAVRSVGNVMAELRRMSSGFQDEIRNALDMPIESDAREEGARLARHPEDADITETVARNPERADEQLLSDHQPAHLETAAGSADPDEQPAPSGATASGIAHQEHQQERQHVAEAAVDDEWVPSDRASG